MISPCSSWLCQLLQGVFQWNFFTGWLFQVPPPRLVTDVLGHLLDLQVIVQPPLAQFPANAAVFHPAPGGFDEGRLRAVDPDDPGT